MPNPKLRFLFVAIALICVGPAAFGFQGGLESLVLQAREQLQPTQPRSLEQKRGQTRWLGQFTLDRLSRTAIGYILAVDLKIPQLIQFLDSPSPDFRLLDDYEKRLRRIVPGPDQILIDDLRASLSELRRLAAGAETSITAAREALDRLLDLGGSRQSEPLTASQREEMQVAFEKLHRSNLTPQLLAAMQRTLSHPNVMIRLRKQAAERESHIPFRIPVHSDTCSDRTRVTADGSLAFAVSCRFPENASAIPLRLDVAGGGAIRAEVSRSSAHIAANICVNGSGTQPLELTPRSVERGEPHVTARLASELQSVRLDGLLNKSHLARRLVSRIAQRKLAEQDASLSSQIENKASEKASEEGWKLANKVNSLLTNNLWSRLESIDFAPSVGLESDSLYLHSRSLYALPEQLGALTLPPALSSDQEQQFEWIGSVHESAVSNVLGTLRGKTLDEATIRGVWQVQLKLTRHAWELPAVSSIPSSITFDPTNACEFRFEDHAAEFVLHLSDGRIGDRPAIGVPCAVTARYRLSSSSEWDSNPSRPHRLCR